MKSTRQTLLLGLRACVIACVTAWAIGASTLVPGFVSASVIYAQDAADEYELKAAFLNKICSYVQWSKRPTGVPDDKFVIGVLGKDPFGESLAKLERLTVGELPIVVKRFTDAKSMGGCHVLFIARESGEEPPQTPEQRLAEVRRRLANEPTFLVSDTTGMAARGSMLNFRLENQRIVLEINNGEARAAHLRIDPRLLKLGTIVNTEKE